MRVRLGDLPTPDNDKRVATRRQTWITDCCTASPPYPQPNPRSAHRPAQAARALQGTRAGGAQAVRSRPGERGFDFLSRGRWKRRGGIRTQHAPDPHVAERKRQRHRHRNPHQELAHHRRALKDARVVACIQQRDRMRQEDSDDGRWHWRNQQRHCSGKPDRPPCARRGLADAPLRKRSAIRDTIHSSGAARMAHTASNISTASAPCKLHIVHLYARTRPAAGRDSDRVWMTHGRDDSRSMARNHRLSDARSPAVRNHHPRTSPAAHT